MKRLIKSAILVCLTVFMLFSTTIVTFAFDNGDPYGDKCVYIPPRINIYK